MRKRPGQQLSRVVIPLGALLIALFVLLPMYWMLSSSFKTQYNVGASPPQYFPDPLSTSSYRAAFSDGFGGFVINSLVVALCSTALVLALGTLAGYALGRLPVRGKFPLMVSLQMISVFPQIAVIAPLYLVMRDIGWLNTYQGIAAPAFLMSPFAVFFLRQFFLGISRELEEAALVEGAGRIRIFFQIAIPLSMTAITTLAVITFIYSWNDYLWPLLIGKKENVRMLTVALGVFRQQGAQNAPDWAGLMAGTTLAILPTLALFMALGKRVINSIGFTGFR